MSGRPESVRGSHGGGAQDLHAITLSSGQVREIIEALGGRTPENPTKLVLALTEALTEVCDETA